MDGVDVGGGLGAVGWALVVSETGGESPRSWHDLGVKQNG